LTLKGAVQNTAFFNPAETGMITELSLMRTKPAGDLDAVCRYPELY
jgi:hypothetical protein